MTESTLQQRTFRQRFPVARPLRIFVVCASSSFVFAAIYLLLFVRDSSSTAIAWKALIFFGAADAFAIWSLWFAEWPVILIEPHRIVWPLIPWRPLRPNSKTLSVDWSETVSFQLVDVPMAEMFLLPLGTHGRAVCIAVFVRDQNVLLRFVPRWLKPYYERRAVLYGTPLLIPPLLEIDPDQLVSTLEQYRSAATPGV